MPQMNITGLNDVTAASVAEVALAADSALDYISIWNTSAAEVLWVCADGRTAAADVGFPLLAGTGYEWPHGRCPADAVSVFSTGVCKYAVQYR